MEYTLTTIKLRVSCWPRSWRRAFTQVGQSHPYRTIAALLSSSVIEYSIVGWAYATSVSFSKTTSRNGVVLIYANWVEDTQRVWEQTRRNPGADSAFVPAWGSASAAFAELTVRNMELKTLGLESRGNTTLLFISHTDTKTYHDLMICFKSNKSTQLC